MDAAAVKEMMRTGNVTISNDTELHARIMQLNSLAAEQELAIKRNIKELAYEMQPSQMIKNFVSKITHDDETVNGLKQTGLALGRDFLVSKIFGGKISLKGFLTQVVMKKAIDYVVHNHSDKLVNGFKRLEGYLTKKQAGTSA
jgi:hypothetical protein